MVLVAFAQRCIMILAGWQRTPPLVIVGKPRCGNFRNHTEFGQGFGVVCGTGFRHDVGSVASAGAKTDKGVGHCRILHSLPEHRPNRKGFVRVCLVTGGLDCQILSVWWSFPALLMLFRGLVILLSWQVHLIGRFPCDVGGHPHRSLLRCEGGQDCIIGRCQRNPDS